MNRTFDPEFKRMLVRLRPILKVAETLSTPNPEDDLFVRAAIVGFSTACNTELWGRNHFAFLQERRLRELGPEKLAWYGDAADVHALFGAVCLGLLLGLYQREELSDEEFGLAEAQLPAFMLRFTDRIAAVKQGGGDKPP